jgi:competence protein ComEC
VVPLTGVLMPACVVAVAVSFVSLALAKIPALIASYALAGITGTVHLFGAAGTHDVRLAKPVMLPIVFCGASVALAMLLAKRRRWLVATALVALTASTVWIATPRTVEAHRRVLEITAIDVGQGESLLIVTPEGKRLLLDSGGLLGFSRSEFDVGEEVTSSYLWNRGIERLDAVAFSHAHSDHLQGMRAVIANFRPKELWMGAEADNALTRGVEQACREYGVTIIRRKRPDSFEYGGARFDVLAPEENLEIDPKQLDDSSMVLRVAYGATSILLPGDSHKKAELMLPLDKVESTVLKVAHHGSATSTTPGFLAAVHPQFALISAGRNNPFHHPRPEVLRRLAQAHVRTYRTDLFGPVTLYLDGTSVTPSVPR